MKYIYELILGNYARCTYLLHSHISGKFVSNERAKEYYNGYGSQEFQSPRSGKFVSNIIYRSSTISSRAICFNPLDRGNLYQIEGNHVVFEREVSLQGFNPLDRGNLYQILLQLLQISHLHLTCFNPLDRGNLYQISLM